MFTIISSSEVAPGLAVKKEKVVQYETHKKLKIISWNIYTMPKMKVQKGRLDRAHSNVQHLQKSDFGIIIFEEAFLPPTGSY